MLTYYFLGAMVLGLMGIFDGWYFGKNGLQFDRVAITISLIESGWIILSILALLFLSFPGNTIIIPILFIAWSIAISIWIWPSEWPHDEDGEITIVGIPIPPEYVTYSSGFGIVYFMASYWAYDNLVG
tara:strand:- start:1467 stop:1850 length:384 start_codon:yes stop_codon:yes gene_type:complete